jgi:hypothetical protein
MEPNVEDKKNVGKIREILRMQFEAAATETEDPTRMMILRELSATATDVPDMLIQAYWEIFEGLPDSELKFEMIRGIGISYWPESASHFIKKFISLSTGGA